ncbi:carboxypeptidase regulatory-like domain-containing protein [Balneolaceae bacterium YR4-1]|uniref:Carboxypeptidase regulatory-like domain-containing protein n=1 Tax=Halalkalibaculum roseum TaxID=2709311 RepID=A0A6M1T2T5_9BACT|nr:carboxypeptidase-like regulatory domain-containing protein [Halalkalibaculum roseum]NGP76315.1 carboxypeptidase regulatory-like domain-containing protein [Halalkalibaculum roseum]
MRLLVSTVILCYLLVFTPILKGQSQAVLSGTVRSLDGSSLPRAHVTLDPYSDNLFYSSETVEVQSNGSFQIVAPRSGIYRVSITGAMHKGLQFPVWIREPGTMQLDIQLDPKNLDDGEYFNSNEYLSWIRVTGNFNGYNYDRGVRFERIDSNTLRATINTSLDTLHYQITGLTSGTTVLPGAADYRLRDSRNYEAIVPVKNNRVVLIYKADSTYFDNKNPFEGYRTTWDFNQSGVKFIDETEDQIQKNLRKEDFFSRLFNYGMFDTDSLPVEQFKYTMQQHYREMWKLNIREIDALEKRLSSLPGSTNDYVRQSMYYKYLLLSEEIHESHDSRLLESSDTEPSLYIGIDFLNASMDVIPPESSLWSLRSDLLFILPEMLGYTKRVTAYMEEVVKKNRDTDITGRVLFELFTNSYDDSGRSEQTQDYYRLILEAFGDNYYARKAREYVQADNN